MDGWTDGRTDGSTDGSTKSMSLRFSSKSGRQLSRQTIKSILKYINMNMREYLRHSQYRKRHDTCTETPSRLREQKSQSPCKSALRRYFSNKLHLKHIFNTIQQQIRIFLAHKYHTKDTQLRKTVRIHPKHKSFLVGPKTSSLLCNKFVNLISIWFLLLFTESNTSVGIGCCIFIRLACLDTIFKFVQLLLVLPFILSVYPYMSLYEVYGGFLYEYFYIRF